MQHTKQLISAFLVSINYYYHRENTLYLRACILAVFTHFALAVCFILMDIGMLGLLNLLNIAPWLMAIRLIQHSRYRSAILTMAFGVYAFVVYSHGYLGAGFGIEMVLWPLSFLVTINARISVRNAIYFGALCLLTFIYLYVFTFSNMSVLSDYRLYIFTLIVALSGAPLIIGMMSMKHTFIRQKAKLEKLAHFDSLTDLFNRHYFYKFLEDRKQEIKMDRSQFCLALVDIDKFKEINDRHGHDIGDIVLKFIAIFLKEKLTHNQVACRWGGEEFLIYLPQNDIHQARTQLNELREGLANATLIQGYPLSVTASFGLICFEASECIDNAVKRADLLLYKAKESGRNRVEI